jgi:AAA domain-containing protein
VTGIRQPIPEELNTFIGREHELGELRTLLRSARMLTLCGPGGIGKTRLALRLLALVAAEFPDGACFVDLADLRDPGLVFSRVSAALGVSEEPGRPLAETVTEVLRPRRLVLARTLASTWWTGAPSWRGICWPARRGCGW